MFAVAPHQLRWPSATEQFFGSSRPVQEAKPRANETMLQPVGRLTKVTDPALCGGGAKAAAPLPIGRDPGIRDEIAPNLTTPHFPLLHTICLNRKWDPHPRYPS